MRTDLHNVDTHTEALLNMMTDLTSKVRSNRDGILAGVNGLQEKMKKAGFSLAEIEVSSEMYISAGSTRNYYFNFFILLCYF